MAKETPYQRKLDDPRRWDMKAANKLDKLVRDNEAKTDTEKKRNAISTTSPFRTKAQRIILSEAA